MNRLGNEKYVIATVLGLISLLVIYGASASNRVASWVDGPGSGRSDTVGLNSSGDRAVAQGDSTTVDPANLTPLQKAGQFPQRQTVVEQSAQADEIRVQPLENTSTAQAQPSTETTSAAPANTQADPAPTVTQPAQETNPEPIRALW